AGAGRSAGRVTVRRWLVERARDLDDALDRLRSRPRRIVFDARTPMNYVMWRPVAERLAADPRIELWHMAGEERGRPVDLYRTVGVTERIVSRLEAQLIRFDLYVCADFVATWLRRRVRRLHIFHGVAGKYGFDEPDPARMGHFDAFFFVNRDRMVKYLRRGVVGREGAFLVGMPKLDRLVDGSLPKEAAARRFGLDPSRPTVLYAPTWSSASSLPALGERLLAALAGLGVNVLVKLHDRLADPRPRYSGGVDWRARLAPLEAAGRLVLARDPDATPALAAADLLVTDHSSVGFEFLLLDRPVVVIDRPELLRETRAHPDQVAWLREVGAVARSVEEVVAEVCLGLAEPWRRRAARRRVARRLFYRPGSATARAVAGVYRLLALTPLPASAQEEPTDHAGASVCAGAGGRGRPASHAADAGAAEVLAAGRRPADRPLAVGGAGGVRP
ncbi:MAG TPA: CDP-glycerol glycerophosphotransferase family protein, partial [Thermodesulfobacteriota bacterium]|nr:CDP-glycerol glycerophosphotransferase family protein [Thermodesulfobacteriota bacterium]